MAGMNSTVTSDFDDVNKVDIIRTLKARGLNVNGSTADMVKRLVNDNCAREEVATEDQQPEEQVEAREKRQRSSTVSGLFSM